MYALCPGLLLKWDDEAKVGWSSHLRVLSFTLPKPTWMIGPFSQKKRTGKSQFQVLSSYLHPGLRTGMSGQSRTNSGVLSSYHHPTSYDVELRSRVMLGVRLCVCICICIQIFLYILLTLFTFVVIETNTFSYVIRIWEGGWMDM